ncbi:MAG: hypothetical protein EZS28_023654 [Streblomastix strix]|uniref:Calpain catalytic domain-containing protein n=1 Tax=Streblomastix strix TaxID=222440 RepID=A0A5J4VEE9_9EUKA|nr:MAG: hypothetical protein EZS28_023654 [Streblomastix strix]
MSTNESSGQSLLDHAGFFHGRVFTVFGDFHRIQIKKQKKNAKRMYNDDDLSMNLEQIEKRAILVEPDLVFRRSLDQLQIFGRFLFKQIRQSCVKDSSVIASLIVLAQVEDHLGLSQLLYDKIYPQEQGESIVSPRGQYIVRLFLNGSYRAVFTDERLLCRVAQNDGEESDQFDNEFDESEDLNAENQQQKEADENEDAEQPLQVTEILQANIQRSGLLWVPLMEKALLRVFSGGFQTEEIPPSEVVYAISRWIPDPSWSLLHVLTGVRKELIRERAKFEKGELLFEGNPREHSQTESRETTENLKAWRHMQGLIQQRAAVVVISTKKNKMSQSESLDVGLINGQYYAVLDVVSVCGLKLFKLKSTKIHRVWKKKFSHLDQSSWTPQLLNILADEQDDMKVQSIIPKKLSDDLTSENDKNKRFSLVKQHSTTGSNSIRKQFQQSITGSNPIQIAHDLITNGQHLQGIFWMEASDVDKYFSDGESMIAINPQSQYVGLPFTRSISFIFSRRYLLMESPELQTRYAPQFLIRKTDTQRIWVLITRHYQSIKKPAYQEGIRQVEREEDEVTLVCYIYKHGRLVPVTDQTQQLIRSSKPTSTGVNGNQSNQQFNVVGNRNLLPYAPRVLSYDPLRMEKIGSSSVDENQEAGELNGYYQHVDREQEAEDQRQMIEYERNRKMSRHIDRHQSRHQHGHSGRSHSGHQRSLSGRSYSGHSHSGRSHSNPRSQIQILDGIKTERSFYNDDDVTWPSQSSSSSSQ